MSAIFPSDNPMAMLPSGVPSLLDCWAKTDEAGRPALPVLDHCRNVGWVFREFEFLMPAITRHLVPSGGNALCALHDIGKVSPGFLLKSPVWRARWQEPLALQAEGWETRHAWTSQKVVAETYRKPPRWLMALGGHHGCYTCSEARPVAAIFSKSIGGGRIAALRDELFSVLCEEFGPPPPEEVVEKGARLHWFTGLMIFCDWLGSNTTWFPLGGAPADAGTAARRAIEDTGVHRKEIKSGLSFPDCFGFDRPRPLQDALIAAMDAPGLYIVEAPMGDGKTEAALAGAYRRWTEGGERGLYFALPTQLTSGRIHERVHDFLRHIVAEPAAFALVHGNAWLSENRVQPLEPNTLGVEDGTEPENALEANRWFSDTRRTMLAPFGVGTIDQALMAVIAAKFSALRMFGLGGKVVVIDEVHSYDPFTSAIVDRLVKWLLELGGSVVILSATLTAARRASLVAAAGANEAAPTDAYPLITKVAAGAASAVHVGVPCGSARVTRVGVALRAADDEGWSAEVAAAANAGACVLVVRNTVDLARESYRALKGKCRDTGVVFGLVHSRFTQRDRLNNESRWMNLLGKNDACRPKKGAILVGTQVLEQSVDIDADLLVTDLAPTDLILQRIGRLHRHPRLRPADFGSPRCIILRPAVDWSADMATILEHLKPHRFIYPPASLYMSERVWRGRPEVGLPLQIRELIEAAHNVIPGDLPETIRTLHGKQMADVEDMRRAAEAGGVFKALALDDIEGAQTRWRMQPSAHLVVLASKPEQQNGRVTLAFPDGRRIAFEPGRFDFPLAHALHLHSIRLPRYLVRDLLHAADRPAWAALHLPDGALAVLDDTGNLTPWPELDTAFSFHYHPEAGLAHTRNDAVPATFEHDDESWF
jgi:CRISPR-associated endonuclease/helicase Cas3